ncbi:MAG: ATP-dependent DNA helicase RecG [Deltaproteobacteria bacterium]|nr:ATP-dependent DNA helicase RecG [Deltaproteobacteria bacterium]
MPGTLHAEVAQLHRCVSALAGGALAPSRAPTAGGGASRPGPAPAPGTDATAPAPIPAPDPETISAARAALAPLLDRRLPTELRARLERLRKRLERLEPSGATRDAVRELLELVEPLGRAGWADELLARSLEALPGVGPKRAEALARRGLERISDLLFWLPTAYEDRREIVGVGELVVGRRATFEAEVKLVDWISLRRGGRFGRYLQAVVGDEHAIVSLKWFRGGETIASRLTKGRRLLVSGDVVRYRFSKEIIHPDIEFLDAGQRSASHAQGAPMAAGSAPPDVEASEGGEIGGTDGRRGEDEPEERARELGRVVPVYSAPEGVNARTLRRLIAQAVESHAELVEGHLPAALVAERGLPGVPDALRALHLPDAATDVERATAFASPAHERLVLEELYLLELGLAMRRARVARQPGIAIDASRPESRDAARALPYRLTQAQRRVMREILEDLAKPHPMNRLVQGDVGSGKTVVALLAAIAVAACGGQTALMAPTELLAEQHFRTLSKLASLLAPKQRLRVGLLTSSLARAEIRAVRGLLALGELDLVVGTHALVQGEVQFRNLVLGIVDEQHRFGVLQRAALAAVRADGRFPHRLVMTATPIPRSLALSLYGEVDVSLIDELPPGRKPIETILLRAGEGARVMELVKATLARGEQVYVVYPLVEESEKIDLRSAIESSEQIARSFPGVRVDLVHGRLEAAERHAAMERFASGETKILVATTVIEVGVDVPNATLMVIEHAERFGLAQLHQLRGRVGRGGEQGTCVLVARGTNAKSEARLRAMVETTDGFRIADADLEIRGPGDFLGTRQSGHVPELRIADLLRDARLVAVARQAARAIVDGDPRLAGRPATRRAVRARWGKRIDLSSVG